MRCRTVIWLIPLLAWAPAAWAQDAKGKDDKSTRDAQYKAIAQEFQEAMRRLGTEFRAAQTVADKEKVKEKALARAQEFGGRMLALAQKHPKSETAFNALVFILSNAAESASADKAVDLLLQDHLAKLGDLFDELAQDPSPAVEKLLRGAMAKGQDKRVKAQATLALGNLYQRKSDALPKGDADAAKEAEKLFNQVVKDYPDQKDLVEEAKGALFVAQNLAIGKVAPDISGEDSDGKKFKLTDYRGKVVVLDFWAGW